MCRHLRQAIGGEKIPCADKACAEGVPRGARCLVVCDHRGGETILYRRCVGSSRLVTWYWADTKGKPLPEFPP